MKLKTYSINVVFKSLFFVGILLSTSVLSAQVFWTEAFQNGCASGCLANTYTGTNGAWTTTSTGVNGNDANVWYISGAECGNGPDTCGSVCGATDPSLHLGMYATLGDNGATYLAGGLGYLYPETNMRAESPIINCSGHSTITLAFNFIGNGDGTLDDATLWYYNGSTWSQIDPLPKPPLGTCNPQAQWTAFSIQLPLDANNNPNVKIGFNWTNNDDNIGTDPSFAVDDITLSSASVGITENPTSNVNLIIFPNPFSSFATLQFSKPLQSAIVGVFNLLGQQVNEFNNVNGNEVIIQKENMNAGIYFVKVTDISGLIGTTKIIIE